MTTSTEGRVQLLFGDTNRTVDLTFDAGFVDLLKNIVPHWPFQILVEQKQFVEPFAGIKQTRSSGYGVHKLDQTGGAIWRLLSEPISCREIGSLLSEAFPAAPAQQIYGDVQTLIANFNNAGLITTDISSG